MSMAITMITMNRKKHCRYCEYQWVSRKEYPKECPRCKRRLDMPIKEDNKK